MKNISTEDYVKAIYKLERKGEKVTTSALALQLQLADASITDMLKKLSEKGLVHYARYRGAGLTATGRRAALKIVRRHRLWEMYLSRFLGFSWDKVHDEAERLEHVTSEDLERRLDEALGFPRSDPHGDPIPDAQGLIGALEATSLATCAPGDVVKVQRVSDADPHLLQHATKLGITLERKLAVKEKRNFDGSMVIRVGVKSEFISDQMARAIFVQKQGEHE